MPPVPLRASFRSLVLGPWSLVTLLGDVSDWCVLGDVSTDRDRTRKSTSRASATGPVSRRANSARATEPTNRRARKCQENKPALYTLTARIVPGAVRKCDVPVPPCSAFRLLSSLSYSHAWPFAVAKATQVCTRNCTSPVAIEESPPSRDPSTRPLRRSPRHPWLSLQRRYMSSCGAETHLLFSGHSTIDASGTSARTAPGVHVGQPAPKAAASKVSHEARRSSEECVGSYASHHPNYESPRFVVV